MSIEFVRISVILQQLFIPPALLPNAYASWGIKNRITCSLLWVTATYWLAKAIPSSIYRWVTERGTTYRQTDISRSAFIEEFVRLNSLNPSFVQPEVSHCPLHHSFGWIVLNASYFYLETIGLLRRGSCEWRPVRHADYDGDDDEGFLSATAACDPHLSISVIHHIFIS